jgi:hypothetical protein
MGPAVPSLGALSDVGHDLIFGTDVERLVKSGMSDSFGLILDARDEGSGHWVVGARAVKAGRQAARRGSLDGTDTSASTMDG